MVSKKRRIRWDRAVEWFSRAQEELADQENVKNIKPLGSLLLQSMIRPELRRKVGDIDLFVIDKKENWEKLQKLKEAAPTLLDELPWNEHPLYVILGYLPSESISFHTKVKHLHDLYAIYKTYKWIEKRSKEAAEEYKNDIVWILAKAMKRDAERPRSLKFWDNPPEAQIQKVFKTLKMLKEYHMLPEKEEFQAFWLNLVSEAARHARSLINTSESERP